MYPESLDPGFRRDDKIGKHSNFYGSISFQPHHLNSVHPQMVDFGLEQGLSDFETAGIVLYSEDFRRAKTPLWAKRCRLWMDTK